ncbi:MAG TPA: Asp-tRNA(Asn)/Glu-tRNA(Gln) amidotransferase subunit GatC [Opitutaceae bacterium]|nr:Asp-tRNA(Asn)/Glu-tRNA(Gln) amidotransferase subunit GatC [Opitutaceae bacterium]
MAGRVDIDIDRLAVLARIELTPEEKARFAAQLGDVLAHVEQLNKITVEGVEPTAHAFPVTNVWRADEPVEGLPVGDALSNAPAKRSDQFVVPKVVE